jgi:hypothetical protein
MACAERVGLDRDEDEDGGGGDIVGFEEVAKEVREEAPRNVHRRDLQRKRLEDAVKKGRNSRSRNWWRERRVVWSAM